MFLVEQELKQFISSSVDCGIFNDKVGQPQVSVVKIFDFLRYHQTNMKQILCHVSWIA